jgi:hypothetical protein
MNFLETQFSLRGKTLPADHGYSLYSAIKQIWHNTHLANQNLEIPSDILLSSISGVGNKQELIYLSRSGLKNQTM